MALDSPHYNDRSLSRWLRQRGESQIRRIRVATLYEIEPSPSYLSRLERLKLCLTLRPPGTLDKHLLIAQSCWPRLTHLSIETSANAAMYSPQAVLPNVRHLRMSLSLSATLIFTSLPNLTSLSMSSALSSSVLSASETMALNTECISALLNALTRLPALTALELPLPPSLVESCVPTLAALRLHSLKLYVRMLAPFHAATPVLVHLRHFTVERLHVHLNWGRATFFHRELKAVLHASKSSELALGDSRWIRVRFACDDVVHVVFKKSVSSTTLSRCNTYRPWWSGGTHPDSAGALLREIECMPRDVNLNIDSVLRDNMWGVTCHGSHRIVTRLTIRVVPRIWRRLKPMFANLVELNLQGHSHVDAAPWGRQRPFSNGALSALRTLILSVYLDRQHSYHCMQHTVAADWDDILFGRLQCVNISLECVQCDQRMHAWLDVHATFAWKDT